MKRTTTTAMIVLLAAGWLSVSVRAESPETMLTRVGTVPETWQEARKGCGNDALTREIDSELKGLQKARQDIVKEKPSKKDAPPGPPSQEDMAAMQDMAQWMMGRQAEDTDFNRGTLKVRETFKAEAAGLEKKLAAIRSHVYKKYDCHEGAAATKADADCAMKRDAELKRQSLATVDAYLKRAGVTFEQYRALVKQHLDVVQQNIPETCAQSSFPAVVLQVKTVESGMYDAVQKLNGELAGICRTAAKASKPFAPGTD